VVNDVHHDAGLHQLSKLKELKHLKLLTDAHTRDLATALTTMTGTITYVSLISTTQQCRETFDSHACAVPVTRLGEC
jgi:hypothetical protein